MKPMKPTTSNQFGTTLEARLRAAAAVAEESARFGDTFVPLPCPSVGPSKNGTVALRAWRNRHFLVSLWDETDSGYRRLSINRAEIDPFTGTWRSGITWDELMDCKTAVGFGSAWAAEAYPPDREVVNVSAIRHLFLLPGPPAWAWKGHA